MPFSINGWMFFFRHQYDLVVNLPSCGSDLWSQKFFQFLEKFKFTWFRASFHRSQLIYCTVRSTILYRCSRYIFASILMYTPTISNRTIALNALITAIWCTFRNIPCFRSILCSHKQKQKKKKKIKKDV